jgi:predicted ATPase
MKLSSLFIKSFRGATKPVMIDFSQDKNITLIYGENGNGKSTIADALVSLCTDSVGSLDDKSQKDLSYLKSLESKNGDLLIELKTDSQTFKATLSDTGKKIVKSPNTNLPRLEALRRSQITNFIESAPSERYKVLSSFVDVSNIQKSESELKKLITTLDRDFGQNVKSLSDSEHTLSETWEKEGKPTGNLKKWVEAEIQKDFSKLEQELKDNNAVLLTWNTLLTTIANIEAEKKKFELATLNEENADKNLKEYQKNNPDSESALLSLLIETKDFLSGKEAVEKCPVCGKENSKEDLLINVETRILKMQELKKLTQELKLSKDAKKNSHSRLLSQVEPFNTQIKRLKTAANELKSFKFEEIFTGKIESEEIKNYYKEFNLIKGILSEEFVKLGEHNVSVNKSVNIHNSITSAHKNIISLTAKCKSLEKLLEKAKEGLKVLEDTRKKHVDNELASISDEVERMYQSIHPSEGLGNVKLFLNHAYQSSLNLTAKFHNLDDITPQSLYSESHLDTLGICIFIALAKKDSNKDVILILDDVVMSVDESHLDRIIGLIHEEAKQFAHIIISTHYRPWRERYRNNRAPNSNIQFVELRKWSKERGITLAKPKIVIDEIKNFLDSPENFHRENLAGTAGRFLEALLDFLTFNFQSKLKRKPANDYTLSELLDSLSKELLKDLKIQKMKIMPDGNFSKNEIEEEIYLKPIIDEIKNLKAVRNQVGAHFTFDGALVSDGDIEDFAIATLQLAELLICPIKGNLPDKNKGSHWETRSGALRL